MIVICSVPKLRLRKIRRQSSPMTERKVDRYTNRLTLLIHSCCHFVILPFSLLKKFPVTGEIALAKNSTWYWKIWRNADYLKLRRLRLWRYLRRVVRHFTTRARGTVCKMHPSLYKLTTPRYGKNNHICNNAYCFERACPPKIKS